VKAAVLLLCCLTVVGCGAVVPSSAQAGPSCFAQPTGLLTIDQLPTGLTQVSENTSPVLGLFGNGDAAYPGFVGLSQRTFLWSGLSGGTPRQFVQQAWADLHYTGNAPAGFIPKSGPLFVAYPSQILQIAEASMDFGNVQGAQKWLDSQRSLYRANNDPHTRAGVTVNLPTERIGDDTFAYQLSNGASGDLYTNIQARSGFVVYGIGIDSGPQYSVGPRVVGLMTSLTAREHAVCGTAA